VAEQQKQQAANYQIPEPYQDVIIIMSLLQ
jgi:hypothetical protein